MMNPDEMRNADVPANLTGKWEAAPASSATVWAVGAEICERLDALSSLVPEVERIEQCLADLGASWVHQSSDALALLERIARAVEREHNLRAETNSGEEWKLRERAEKAEAAGDRAKFWRDHYLHEQQRADEAEARVTRLESEVKWHSDIASRLLRERDAAQARVRELEAHNIALVAAGKFVSAERDRLAAEEDDAD